jgi:biotin carboxylase
MRMPSAYREDAYSEGVGKRVLLFAATTGYQVRAFGEAARNAGMELVLATDRCHILENPWGDEAVPMQFDDAIEARGPFDGIVAVGDGPAETAGGVAERLRLRFHPAKAVAAARNKFLSRERFRAAGLLTPEYVLDASPRRYPCVVKPVGLSASRGVIRANDAREYQAAAARIRKITDQSIQVEDYIPGREFALEALVTCGRLQTLAIFDKPDPLEGPFFEETIYVTPSRESDTVQRAIIETTQGAISALGLTDGPIHAEMRVNDLGVWMLEAAGRPIGGLCSGVLRFEGGRSFEEIILRHAAGEDMSPLRLASGAHGVMMLPIPRAGIFERVDGVEQARAEGAEEVLITAKQGQEFVPLPEGASYLGFMFARGKTADDVERTLRAAHGSLHFHFTAALPVVR